MQGTTSIVFVSLFWILLARERASIQDEIHKEIEWHAVSTADLLLREIGQNEPPEQFLRDLSDPHKQQELDQIFQAKLGHLGLMKVKIYSSIGEVVYSTEKDLIGEYFGEGEGFKKALAGKVAVLNIEPKAYESEYGEAPPRVGMAEVYIPWVMLESGKTEFIFESYKDFTPYQEKLERRSKEEAQVLGFLLGCGLFVTLTVLWVNIRLERRITALERLLPICSGCKKIRTEDKLRGGDKWVVLEEYFQGRNKIDFTHGICPDCGEEFYGEHYKRAQRGRKET